VEDDRLVACHPRHGNIALTPKNKDVFGGSEGFFSDVTFERDQAGVLTGMRVSGAAGRVRNVLFEKQKQ
jgi:hypothetical protein